MVARAQFVEAADDPLAGLIRKGAHREAISLCAREHGAGLGRLCMALLGSQQEAEETVQEALITAHDAFGQWRGEGTARAFVYGIARRLCAKKLAVRARRERRLRLVHDAGAEGQLPDDALERQRRAFRVRDALEELKPSEREALVLRYQSGLSYREIGDACGIDEAAARKRTSRALAKMRTLLKDEVT